MQRCERDRIFRNHMEKTVRITLLSRSEGVRFFSRSNSADASSTMERTPE